MTITLKGPWGSRSRDPFKFWGPNHIYGTVKARVVKFLANVNSRSRSLFAVARPSVVCLSSVCRLSVTLVRPTQGVQIFGNISTALGTLAIR